MRHKRELPSTVTPERQSRKSGTTKVKEPLVEKERKSPRKELFVNKENDEHVDQVTGDDIRNLMNIVSIQLRQTSK